MNYCFKCQSLYAQAGTCNCFVTAQPAQPVPVQPYPGMPTPWVVPYTPPVKPSVIVGGTTGQAVTDVPKGWTLAITNPTLLEMLPPGAPTVWRA